MIETQKVEILKAEDALGALVRAETDIQIATAKQYPRSISAFRDECLSCATLDEETAVSCIYTLPRGAKNITGPSVRMAELVASSWGNLRVQTRLIAIDNESVTVQSACHDLEKNIAVSVEARRRITDSRGKRYNEDMVNVTIAAAHSVAYRNAVMRVIPRAIWKPIEDACRKLIAGDEKSLGERRQKAVAFFEGQKVSLKRILARIERESIEEVTLDDVVVLRGIATAIQEGATTLQEAFPEPLSPGVSQSRKLDLDAVVGAAKATANGGERQPGDESEEDDKKDRVKKLLEEAKQRKGSLDGLRNKILKVSSDKLLGILPDDLQNKTKEVLEHMLADVEAADSQ